MHITTSSGSRGRRCGSPRPPSRTGTSRRQDRVSARRRSRSVTIAGTRRALREVVIRPRADRTRRSTTTACGVLLAPASDRRVRSGAGTLAPCQLRCRRTSSSSGVPGVSTSASRQLGSTWPRLGDRRRPRIETLPPLGHRLDGSLVSGACALEISGQSVATKITLTRPVGRTASGCCPRRRESAPTGQNGGDQCLASGGTPRPFHSRVCRDHDKAPDQCRWSRYANCR
jgi:hypothetical protein